MIKQEEFEEWRIERDKALLSLDVMEFREFWNKWYKKGLYTSELPVSDDLVELSMRQCVLALESSTEDQKEEARQWLRDHGYTDDPWGERGDS